MRGAVHIARDKPCQDAIKLYGAPLYSVACVADGHGSGRCPYSDEGARAAVEIACELLKNVLDSAGNVEDARKFLNEQKEIYIPKRIEALWKERVDSLWKERADKPPDASASSDRLFPYELYGTTLLSIVITDAFAFAVQIGDGDMLMIDADGEAGRLFPATEQAGSETYSLCMENSWQYVQTQLLRLPEKRPLLFLLSSDGYANSFTEASGFLKAGKDIFAMWRENGPEYIRENIEDWLTRSSEMGSGDDITLALAVTE